MKYYAEAQRDLEDEEGESGLSADGDSEDDDGSLGEVDLPLSDEEPSSKKGKFSSLGPERAWTTVSLVATLLFFLLSLEFFFVV